MLIRSADLETLASGLLEAWGVPNREARLTARHLVESNLVGVDSHGIMRLPQYIDLIQQHDIDPNARIVLSEDRGSIVAFDAHYALGPAAVWDAATIAIERAAKHGIALALVRNSGHAGRIGAYTELMAASGVVALAFCNSPIYGHYVAPPGAREGRLATNPISYAFPTTDGPVVADFSTSSMPEGVVRLLRDRDRQAPPDMLLDADGQPTTDPNALYADRRGVILPLGGSVNGHKGFSLGLLVEILAGTLAGDAATDPTLKGNNVAFIGIAIDATPARAAFANLAGQLVDYIHSAHAIASDTKVMVPGERERRMRSARLQSGVPVDDVTWRQIMARAEHVSYPLPNMFIAESRQ